MWSQYVCHNSICSRKGKAVRRSGDDPVCSFCKTQLCLLRELKPWENDMQRLVDEAYENAAAEEMDMIDDSLRLINTNVPHAIN